MTQPAVKLTTPLEYALAYIERGFAVVPLHYITADGACSCGQPHDGENGGPGPNGRGKHPHTLFARNGALSATKDPEQARAWWGAEPRMNIGIATGEASGVIAVDIDPRAGGDATWAQFVERNGAEVPSTVVQMTGGGGQHLLFHYAPGVTVRSPGKGVDIKGNGGYIVAEPSSHHTGGKYCWDAECDPLEGIAAAPIPDWLASKPAQLLTMHRAPMTGYLHPDRAAELRAALRHIDADDYQAWIAVGMALHSTDAPEAFELWDAYSQRSEKYNAAAQRAKWLSFGKRSDGLNVESIFVWARDQGWCGDYDRAAAPAESVRIAPPPGARAASDTPEGLGLLQVPGVLGRVVDYANATAPKAQPLFATGAALALGATVCGRRFRGMPFRNWPSLYLVHVGQSGCGKEHAETVIDAILTEAEQPQLLGPGGYASDSAVMGALISQPSHIAIIDEIGALLANLQSDGAMHGRSAVNTLIEAWGSLHGSMRPKAYSTNGLQETEAAAKLARIVFNPAITLLGMTTPQRFYSAMDEGSIEGGFLSRLLILETDIGRQPMGIGADVDVPRIVVDWIGAAMRGPAGNLSGAPTPSGMKPTPINVPTSAEAVRAIRAYELEVIASQNRLDAESLAQIEGRSVEKALRIATTLAVSDRVDAPKITAEHVQWAVALVRWATDRTLQAVRDNMHGSKFGAWQAAVLRTLRAGGSRGRTERELAQYCRPFDSLPPRDRRQVLDALRAKGAAELVEMASVSGRGRKRQSWVALDTSGADDE